MKLFFTNFKLNKPGIGLLVLALTIGGISAKAAEDSRSSSSGYTFCVKSKSNDDVSYPGTANCPKGYTKLVIGQSGEDGATGPAGPIGATGPAGPIGATGPAGAVGLNGTNGVDGATGPIGPIGPIGPAGSAGSAGANAPATKYAAGYVLVKRGTGSPTVWGFYSTSLGSPFDNTASGTFRFTCRENQAPCVVSFAAQSTAAGVTVWPRVMIYKSDINTGQVFGQCEYGDGVSSTSPYGAVGIATTPIASSMPTALSINIGGSLDCGAGALQTYPGLGTPTAGDVNFIVVPTGYYDVQSNFTFKG